MTRFRRFAKLAAVLLAVFTSACSPVYVLRSAVQEGKILWGREPIERVLADAQRPEAELAKLREILEVRQFAAEALGLDVGGSYASISDTGAISPIHLVTAARSDRLELRTWWFPIVGRMPYKGYFSGERARALADDLEARGFDTAVQKAVAFSTLGWFDDPLLSHLLEKRRIELVTIVLHELLHQTIYVRNASAWNESLATFVGYRGAADYFCRDDSEPALCSLAESRFRDAILLSDFLDATRADLDAFFAEKPRLRKEKDARYGDLVEAAKTIPLETDEFRPVFGERPNNASFLLRHAYYHRLADFEARCRRFGGLRPFVEHLRGTFGSGASPAVPVVASRKR